MSAYSNYILNLKLERLEEENEALKKRVVMLEKYLNFIEEE